MNAALLVALGSGPLASQDHLSLHPETSAIVLHVPDVQAVVAAYSNTALARLTRDEDFRSVLGELVGGEGAAPVDLVELWRTNYRALVDQGTVPPFLEMAAGARSLSVSLAVPGGDLFEYAQRSDRSKDDDAGLRLVIDFVDEEALEAVLDMALDQLGETTVDGRLLKPESRRLEGDGGAWGTKDLVVWRHRQPDGAKDDGAESATLFAGGRRLALTYGNVDPEAFTGQVARGGRDDSVEARFRAESPKWADPAATPLFEVDIVPFVDRMVEAEVPLLLPALSVADGLFGPFVSMVVYGGHWRMALDGHGRFHLEGAHAPYRAGRSTQLLGGQSLNARSLTLAHPEALITTVTSLDTAALTRLVGDLIGGDDPDTLASIEEAYGFRPDRDLAAPLGDAIGYSLPRLGSLIAAPNFMGAVKLDDPVAFVRGMDGLTRMLAAERDDVIVARDEYKKISTLYTFSMPGLFGEPGAGPLPIDLGQVIKPTVAVLEDRVVLTLNRAHAKKEVRRIAKLARLDGEPAIHEGLASFGKLDGATTLSHADWINFIGGVYSQVRAFGPLLANADLPFAVEALPEPEMIVRFFEPSRQRVALVNGRIHHRATSSLGPELNLVIPLGVLSVIVVPNVMARLEEAKQARQEAEISRLQHQLEMAKLGRLSTTDLSEEELTERARLDLDVLAKALEIHQLKLEGSYPNGLDVLADSPDGSTPPLLEPMFLADPWGRPFVYRVKGGDCELYSMGPNRTDDGGAADDVVSR